jgi:hypothetical protein
VKGPAPRRSGAPAGRQRAILVVGAGRSGTSALTRGVQALGVELGDRLRMATGKNPTGFFEDRDFLRVAKQVRARFGLRSESVSLVAERAWLETDLSDLRKEALEIAQERFGKVPVWGFKYSQTLRFLPFWEDVLREAGLDVAFVMALRNPLSVARSRAKLDAQRGLQEKSDLEWLVNVVPYFRQMAAHRLVVVDFDLLMDDPRRQLERVAALLDLPLDDAIRAGVRSYAASFLKEMRHTRFGDAALFADERLSPLTRDAYLWLRRLATDELALEAPEFWRAWEQIEDGLQSLRPVLAHVDRLEAELRRAGFGPRALWRRFVTRIPRPTRR